MRVLVSIIYFDSSHTAQALCSHYVSQQGYKLHLCSTIDELMASMRHLKPLLVVVGETWEQWQQHWDCCIAALVSELPASIFQLMTFDRSPSTEQLIQFGIEECWQRSNLSEWAAEIEDRLKRQLRQRLQQRRVLLVDDDKVSQLVGLALLNSVGFTVNSESSGEAALVALELESYDLVITDIEMPGLTGYEWAKLWRAHEPSLRRPRQKIISLSAHGKNKWEAYFDGYIQKPLNLSKLVELLPGLMD